MKLSRLINLLLSALLWLVATNLNAGEPCTPFEARRVDNQLLAEMRDAAHEGRLYRVVPGRARVEFCVRHFPFQEFRGSFTRLVGGLTVPSTLDRHGRALLLVHTTTMESSEPDLDSLVQSHEFMDVLHYPEILFVGRDFEWYSPNRARINGDLTLHGVTQPVTFDTELTVLENDVDDTPRTVFLKGTSEVSRLAFDMRSYRMLVSETVRLCLSVELTRWED